MKNHARNLSKSELSFIRRSMGLTIKDMAHAVGLKLPSYYYYETRFTGEAVPAWLSRKVCALARKRGVDLSPRALRALKGDSPGKPTSDQASLLRDILKTLNDIKVMVRDRGPSAVLVVQDNPPRSGRGASGASGRLQ